MTKEKLLEGILHLPTKHFNDLAEDDQIIEGNQGRVHYKMTKELIPFLGLTLFVLSVSGPRIKRLAFIREIAEELGEPLDTDRHPTSSYIDLASWEAGRVEERLRRG